MKTKNIILFITGFCIYITSEVLFRGYSYPAMGICGGIALIILNMINDRISWDLDLLVQTSIGACIITSMELIVGLICKITNYPPMWDYSNMPLNFMGIICVPFFLAWIVMSFIGILIADAVSYYVYEDPPVPYYKLFGKTIIRFKEKLCKIGMYECFHCLSKSVIWDADFSFSDMGYDGEGIVHCCHCDNCGAEIEYWIDFDNYDE